MLIAVFHQQETGAPGPAGAGAAPRGAAVSWVAGRFYIHGRGQVSLSELGSLDASGRLAWTDTGARDWLRSQVPTHGEGPTPSADAVTPDPTVWGDERPPVWRRVTAEQYRIATWVALGVVAVLLIVLLSPGGR